jgi:HSP20 family protein
MVRLFKDPFFSTIDSVFESMSNVVTKPSSIVDKTDNGYKLTILVPGLTKDDLKIIVKDRKLTIKHESEENDFINKFTKSYFLSDDIIEKKITAEVKNGVLVVDLPTKDEESVEQVINIK